MSRTAAYVGLCINATCVALLGYSGFLSHKLNQDKDKAIESLQETVEFWRAYSDELEGGFHRIDRKVLEQQLKMHPKAVWGQVQHTEGVHKDGGKWTRDVWTMLPKELFSVQGTEDTYNRIHSGIDDMPEKK